MQNDFLSTLAARAIHETEAVSAAGSLQPRLASRFELAGAHPLPTLEGLNEGEAPVQGESLLAARPQPPRQDLPEPRHVRARPTPNDETGLNQPSRRGLEARETSQFASRSQIQPDADPDRDKALAPQPTFESHRRQDRGDAFYGRQGESAVRVAPVPPPENHPGTRLISEQVTIIRQELQPPQPGAQRAAEAESEQQRQAAVQPEPAPLAEDRSNARIVPEKIIITRQELQPPQTGIQSQFIPASAAQAPTIHVTIGRIEVKASTPVAMHASRSVAPAPATMSLDEYLRRRQGGNP